MGYCSVTLPAATQILRYQDGRPASANGNTTAKGGPAMNVTGRQGGDWGTTCTQIFCHFCVLTMNVYGRWFLSLDLSPRLYMIPASWM